jgi:hypothetical protein
MYGRSANPEQASSASSFRNRSSWMRRLRTLRGQSRFRPQTFKTCRFETHGVYLKRSGRRVPHYVPLGIGRIWFRYWARNYWPRVLRRPQLARPCLGVMGPWYPLAVKSAGSNHPVI